MTTKSTQDERQRLQESATFAQERAASVIDQVLLSRRGRDLWAAAPHFNSRERDAQIRLAYVLMLDALIAAPAAVQNARQMLRSLLLEEDPKAAELHAALVGSHTPPA